MYKYPAICVHTYHWVTIILICVVAYVIWMHECNMAGMFMYACIVSGYLFLTPSWKCKRRFKCSCVSLYTCVMYVDRYGSASFVLRVFFCFCLLVYNSASPIYGCFRSPLMHSPWPLKPCCVWLPSSDVSLSLNDFLSLSFPCWRLSWPVPIFVPIPVSLCFIQFCLEWRWSRNLLLKYLVLFLGATYVIVQETRPK